MGRASTQWTTDTKEGLGTDIWKWDQELGEKCTK